MTTYGRHICNTKLYKNIVSSLTLTEILDGVVLLVLL